jgi:outer membrane protein assembly factor BamB
MIRLCLLLLILCVRPIAGQELWSTYRADPQRTASDGKAGPATAKILWVQKSKEHYIAAPVPMDKRLLLASLGAFNLGNFSCIATDAKPAQRLVWNKTTPYLKLPSVSSPGLMGKRIVFGDGMHQTDGATLHCLDGETGLPLWQFVVPGTLVHLEGSPTIAAGKAYIGGGAAGVLCVEATKAHFKGADVDLDTLAKSRLAQWKEMNDRYEKEKKTDPFALPPTEDQLPKASPKLLWQQGKEKWHVDAPVALVGDKLVVGSAFLDKEKVGDRAIFCLDAAKGDVLWRAPVKLNPWGGPSVAGNTIVVAGSTIGYAPAQIKGAKGFVAALDLADGKAKWTKEVTGGVVSCAALADGAAVVTATDGKVRAFEIETGERRWIYDAKAPLFAPVAVAQGIAYAGDLKGVLHAIDLKTGEAKWTLDLATHPETKAPGMFYGGPVVQGGRLYAATCNIEQAQTETVIVCIGEK